MNEEKELSPEVVEALHSGRKIEAIKMLRAQRGLDLAEAREQVDLYVTEHPQKQPGRRHSEMNLIPLVVAAAIAITAWLAFEYL